MGCLAGRYGEHHQRQCGSEHDLNSERLEDLDLGPWVNPRRVAAHQKTKRERQGGTEQLGHPISSHVSSAELPAQIGCERHSRVVVSARDMATHVDHRHESCADRQRS